MTRLSRTLGYLVPFTRIAIKAPISRLEFATRLAGRIDTHSSAVDWWMGRRGGPGRVRGSVSVERVTLIVEPPLHDRRYYVPLAFGRISGVTNEATLLLTCVPRPFQLAVLLIFLVTAILLSSETRWIWLLPVGYHLLGCLAFPSEVERLIRSLRDAVEEPAGVPAAGAA